MNNRTYTKYRLSNERQDVNPGSQSVPQSDMDLVKTINCTTFYRRSTAFPLRGYFPLFFSFSAGHMTPLHAHFSLTFTIKGLFTHCAVHNDLSLLAGC